MSLRRTIPLPSAVRDLRANRLARPVLVVAGTFDLGAIMRQAVRQARGLRASGLSWARRMSVALQFVWTEAKRAMAATTRRAA